MCLITKQTEAFIATEDIEVYKILTEDLMSCFEYFSYELNKEYQTEIERNDNYFFFNEGDHSFLIKKEGLNPYPTIRELKEKDYISYGQGFHSVNNIELLKVESLQHLLNDNHSIFKCIIPLGSEYYTNDYGCVVSNRIIIKEKV